MQTPNKQLINNPIERFLIWLSTADSEVLADCPKWERLKYAAFGASLLVPFLFGMISASYAVSTLTSKIFIIAGFALVWGFIILTIDRAMLATYRAFVPTKHKIGQFCLRMTVALLMGLTVSHPLTLLLFKDTIHTEVEKERMEEMKQVRESLAVEKQALDLKIDAATKNLQQQQQVYQDTLGGAFLNNQKQPEAAAQAIADRKANTDQFADLDAQIKDYRTDRDRIQAEYNQWVTTYEDEVSGRRTGRSGIGPAARAIENDELVWRRTELKRLSQALAGLTQQRTEMSTAITAQQSQANARITASRQQVEQQKLSLFKEQQGQMLAIAQSQIDSASGELKRLRGEATQLSELAANQSDQLEDQSRADLMTQTLALHHLFEKEGGLFAMSVYIVLASLFVLIDTIPLVVKFFAVPGIYDERLDIKERSAKAEKMNEMYRVAELSKLSDLSDIDYESFKELLRKRDLVHSLIHYQPKTVDLGELTETPTAAPQPAPRSESVPIPSLQNRIETPVELPPIGLEPQEKFQSLRNTNATVVPFNQVEEDETEYHEVEFTAPVAAEPEPVAEPMVYDNQIYSTEPEPVLQPGFGDLMIEDKKERQAIMEQLQANG